MTERQFYYTTDGTSVVGPVAADWLWDCVNSHRLNSEIQVCEVGTEHWLRFTSLPDSVFSLRILMQASPQNFEKAELLHLQAQNRLIKCQSHVEVYGYRSAEIEQVARDGLEFIEAAIKLIPNCPKYLNVQALLLADGLGQKKAGLTILQEAAKIAPDDIQIKQNIRALTNRSVGCLVLFAAGGSLFFSVFYTISRICLV